jgi:hypothetical protein
MKESPGTRGHEIIDARKEKEKRKGLASLIVDSYWQEY